MGNGPVCLTGHQIKAIHECTTVVGKQDVSKSLVPWGNCMPFYSKSKELNF